MFAQGRRSGMDRAAVLRRRRALREGTARWDGWRKTGDENKEGRGGLTALRWQQNRRVGGDAPG